MKFDKKLVVGKLIKRYKRFLADVELKDGSVVTAHTPNTGSMLGCVDPGNRVWLYDTENPNRKYPYSWEVVEIPGPIKVGINTSLSNRLIEEAIKNNVILELAGYNNIRREVKYGTNSRIDLLLETHPHYPDCYVEVKNVTLVQNKIAMFPDAVSERASKHLRELIAMVEQGHRAVICFCVQRNDANLFHPARHIDPEYGMWFDRAIQQGVEAIAYGASPTAEEIIIDRRLELVEGKIQITHEDMLPIQ